MGILEDILEGQKRIEAQLQAMPIALLLLLDIKELGWEVSLGEEPGYYGQPPQSLVTITKKGVFWRATGKNWLDALANAHKTALLQEEDAG